MTYVWAYLAGVLTFINPCVLPLLPITLAAALQASRLGPLALAGGLVAAFVVIGVGVTAFGYALGIDQAHVNRVAAAVMVAFGVVLLIPRLQDWAALAVSPLADRAHAGVGRAGGGGLAAQFLIGVLLGAVWSPCIGPTLGGAIGLAATGEGLGHATGVMLVFGGGVATILLGLAYGSREAIGARRGQLNALLPWAKPLLGGALVLVGTAILFHVDRRVEAWLLDVLPAWLVDLSVAV